MAAQAMQNNTSERARQQRELRALRLQSSIIGARCAVLLLRFLQRPFAWVFWTLEQRIARLVDEIERVRT
jgi:hypothetical protein